MSDTSNALTTINTDINIEEISLSEKRKKNYIELRENKLNGNLNGIPLFYTFPKLASILPSLPKGFQILWTANSGVGKTQSWISIFVYTIWYLKKYHPELNLKVKLVIALLEDTKDMFIDRLYSMMIYQLYGIVVDGMQLNSMTESILDIEMLEKIDNAQKEIDLLLEDIEIIDSVYNPTGLYKWARTISNNLGIHHSKKVEFTNEDGTKEMKDIYSHYEPNDNNQQVLMIVDNLNNLAEEANLNERQTINKWSRTYCRLQITKHWKWTVINILQQASDSEKQQFDYKGNSIIEKIKPSLDGLGNSKECQRDHLLVLGLFAPDRYGIATYPENNGYKISILRDNFRSLLVIKGNLTKTNVEIPFYFNGGCSYMKELPEPSKVNYNDFKIKTGNPD